MGLKDHIRKSNFAMTFLEDQSILNNIITFDLSSIICLMKDICLIELEMGLITIAGPFIAFLETLTLSTKGWSSCLIHKENGVNYYYLILAEPLLSFLFYSPSPFKVLSTSSVSVSTFENLRPSKVSSYLKIT